MKKQTIVVSAIVLSTAALSAVILTYNRPTATAETAEHSEHAEHKDSHGHDDRHEDEDKEGHAEGGDPELIRFSDAQVKANGILIEQAGPAVIKGVLHVPGEVKPNANRTAELSARTAGVLKQVLVDPGQAVRKGQALAVIASTAVATLRGELATAEQKLSLARLVFSREQKLWEEKISARQDYEQAEYALREAEIEMTAARNRLRAIGAEGGGAAADLTLRAPFDGTIIARSAAAGQAVQEDSVLFTLSDLRQVWMDAAVPAVDLPNIRPGADARITVPGVSAVQSGTISNIGAVLGDASRAATVRIVLANPAGVLRPGMVASVDLVTGEATVPVAVAAEAVHALHDRPTVYVRAEGGFKPTVVKTGRTDGARVEILEGLPAGARYASTGSYVVKAEQGKPAAEHEH